MQRATAGPRYDSDRAAIPGLFANGELESPATLA
jgi:hypothetical protein